MHAMWLNNNNKMAPAVWWRVERYVGKLFLYPANNPSEHRSHFGKAKYIAMYAEPQKFTR